MPELPEVEIVCRNLTEILNPPVKLSGSHFWRKDLRYKIPVAKIQRLQGKTLRTVRRRAKYTLFDFKDEVLISHLGMTGSWREYRGDIDDLLNQKHDHLALRFGGDQWLIYNDPRRFGFIEVISSSNLLKYFGKYGSEPLEIIDINLIVSVFMQKSAPIKSVIMNQEYIVGVGNIYASEALFKARIHPLRRACDISLKEYKLLIKHIQKILSEAIEYGGSTIQNYRNAKSQSGKFQLHFSVYDRGGLECPQCRAKIMVEKIAGRSTFFCSSCQK